MSRRRESWSEVIRALGQSFVDVLRAEAGLIGDQWKSAGIKYGIAIGLVSTGFFMTFWLIGLLVFAAVDGLRAAMDWQLWQAALTTALGLFLLMLTLALIGFLLIRRTDGPVKTAQQRFADHLDWWQMRLLGEEHTLEEGDWDGKSNGQGTAEG